MNRCEPEGIAYVPAGSPFFTPFRGMLVSEYYAARVAAYSADDNGDPATTNSAGLTFMSGVTGAEGAVVDPLTGDFLFSTFSITNRVIAVRGFAVPAPDLSLSGIPSPSPVTLGNSLTYNLTVTNLSLYTATGTVVGDVLPASATFVSATPSQGTCTNIGGTIVCALGTVIGNGAATVQLVVTPQAAGAITNTAAVSASEFEPNTANNTNILVVTVTPASTNQPPVAQCNNVTTNADASCVATVAVAQIDNASHDPDGDPITLSLSPAGPYTKGIHSVTLTVADNKGGTNTCSATVTVLDNTKPTVSCPGNFATNLLSGISSAVINFPAPTTGVNCGTVTFQYTPLSGSTFTAGTTPVLCVATDGSGNTNTCSFNVTVATNNNPNALCHDVTVSLTSGCQTNITAAQVDNGSSDPDGDLITLSLSPAGQFGVGTTPVTLTVADNRGGTNTCEANIVVSDHILPSLTCPGNIVTNLPVGVSNAVVHFSFLASDNCGLASTNVLPASGSTFALGTNPVVITAVDTSGNTNTCSFSVIVLATPPIPHDFAILSLNPPKTINLKAATPALTKRVKVQIQNLSPQTEIISNLTVLANLVSVTLSNLHTSCTPPTADLIQGPPNVVPKTLKPKGKVNVFFNVTFSTNCVPDAVKSTGKNPGHEDFSYTATLNPAALDGNADTNLSNDVCPRPPNLATGDKGCGKKDPVTKQLGVRVVTDVILKLP